LFATGGNQWNCAFSLASNLFLSAGTRTFQNLTKSDPLVERERYQAVYVAPGLSGTDYTALQQLVAPGGFLEQFVTLGGVAVINAGSTLGDQTAIAPEGVGFADGTQHNTESIQIPNHQYIMGTDFGGKLLTDSDFSAWQPTDFGTLTNLPPQATVLLTNSGGPSWAEYAHGAGRVLVTTLSYCWDSKPNSQQAAASNLLLYSRFYSGSALTPAPTVTQTGTPTVTPTSTATRTFTPGTPRSPTPSRTPTPRIIRGDADGNGSVTAADLDALIHAIFSSTYPPGADVNADGVVTAADIPALLGLLP
jgi:hypothetical protein